MALVLAWTIPAGVSAQQSKAAAPPLVLDGVTVVDVEHGTLVADQRLVIVGNRIQTLGGMIAVKIPEGAQVVDARGKYLIPGLWDMHTHLTNDLEQSPDFLSFFIAHGVTGIRDMGLRVIGIDAMLQWRREVLDGTRVGPRILTTGPMIDVPTGGVDEGARSVATPEDARHVVDSLKQAGADFIKIHSSYMSREIYFALAAEARRMGIPFVGHLPVTVPVAEASDSGQHSIEHVNEIQSPCSEPVAGSKGWPHQEENETECAALAAKFVRNNTWFTPTLIVFSSPSDIPPPVKQLVQESHRFGVPMLAGTDLFSIRPALLSDELALLVEVGLKPLEALQTATLNPAKYLGATDSLGTVAPGKLADLVLLDGDPLADIANTAKVRAVVANGRYFDRKTLDGLLTTVQGP